MSAQKIKITINTNTLMNRGPQIEKKRNKHGAAALTAQESRILVQYKAIMNGEAE